MPLETFIADTRKAVDADAAKAHVVFAAEGTLVGVTEVDIKTGRHAFKVDEPPGPDAELLPRLVRPKIQ